MEKWVVAAKRADFSGIARRFGIDPVTARLIRNREIIGDAAIHRYLYGTVEDLGDPWTMKDMDRAVELLEENIRDQKNIRILGDYDIDGVMATHILLSGLKKLGARADAVIPHRITDGYGISSHLIQEARKNGIDTIVTCDNGIAAYDQILEAKALGMTVLVTDHHEVPFEEEEGKRREIIPPADAVVNPRQQACSYEFPGICGAVVAMKVMQALFEKLRPKENLLEELLEFAAIATVGDVMDLTGENRILVKEGLKRLRATKNPGLQELIRVNGLEPEQVGTYHIGFVLGPCLNASGRLDTARRALALLETQNRQEAAVLAGDLKNLNDSRKEMTARGVEEAIDQVEQKGMLSDSVLVVYLPQCHESLAGIIAGRIRERYHRPAFVLTRGEDGIKGSGRSTEAYSMYEKLCQCREYLTKFGGHPMAAGLSLKEENIGIFRKKLNEYAGLTPEDFVEKITIDVPMPIHYIRKELIQELKLLEPYGKGNEKPLFAQKGLRIKNLRILGKNRNVVRMQLADPEGYEMTGIYFGDGETFEKQVRGRETVSVLYYPEINVYQGKERIQLVVRSWC